MQLDLFADSHDVMLRNDVLDALHRRHAADARRAYDRLVEAYPADDAVPALATLIAALEDTSMTCFTGHQALATVRRVLADEIMPAARRLFGEQAARSWIAPCWRVLAQRAVALPFHADHSEDHAAPMWLLAGDPASAKQAVERIASWRRIPVPLGWMTEARYRDDGLDAAWPLIAELAWLAPAWCEALIRRLGEPALDALRRQFDAEFAGTGESADFAWFPAWLLTVKPALADRLREAWLSRQVDAQRATSLLWQILSLERQGRQHDLVERRAELRGLHAGLYAAYMKTR